LGMNLTTSICSVIPNL